MTVLEFNNNNECVKYACNAISERENSRNSAIWPYILSLVIKESEWKPSNKTHIAGSLHIIDHMNKTL